MVMDFLALKSLRTGWLEAFINETVRIKDSKTSSTNILSMILFKAACIEKR